MLIAPHAELTDRMVNNKRFSLTHRSQAYRKFVIIDFEIHPPALNIFKLPLPSEQEERLRHDRLIH